MRDTNTDTIELLNPIVAYRRQVGMTQDALAEMAGCSTGAVLRAEQGLYNSVLPCLEEMIPSENPNGGLAGAYRRWQFLHRQEAKLHLPESLGFLKPKMSPLYQWRTHHDYSAVGVCKILCVHPAVWANMEGGKTRSLSSQLMEALREGNYSEDFIKFLTDKQQEFCNAIKR